MTQNRLDAWPVLSGSGTGVASDYAEYTRQFSDSQLRLRATFETLVVASFSTAWSTTSSNSGLRRRREAHSRTCWR